MSLTHNPSIYGVVRNIPSSFHSSDLRNFFSDFIEKGKFICFHFKHRPEFSKQLSDVVTSGPKARNGTFCGVFQVPDEPSLMELIRKYNETNWVDSHGNCMKSHCFIHKIRVSSNSSAKKNIAASFVGYSTRGESSHRRRHAVTEEFSQLDLLSLSELRPPTHIMPRGNVGTTIQEFMKLIKDCKLPPRIIKKLALKFPTTGSNRRYGNVPFQYMETLLPPTSSAYERAYTAGGDEIEKNSSPESDQTALHHQSQKEIQQSASGDEESGPDDDNDTCEEWERHEALHSDVTSQERTKERLFEEEIELKWEKGGSGLVFYTDAQYWEEQEGDFDEQTTDDWDVDMSIYYGGTGDMDARQYQQMRKERSFRDGVYDGSFENALKSKKRRKKARSESPPGSKRRGYFERHTKGVGRRLLEKKGWKDGDPLGPSANVGAITDPVLVDGQHPRLRKGLGYHGEKLLAEHDTHGHHKKGLHKRVPIRLFRNVRSVEPMASHSYMFPQFDFNLSNGFKERTRSERRKAVPGDDGIVITTAYDDPLDIDRSVGLLRSSHPSAIKRRKVDAKEGTSTLRQSNDAALTHGVGRSGLQNQHRSSFVHAGGDESSPKTEACPSVKLSPTIRFVSGGLLKDKVLL